MPRTTTGASLSAAAGVDTRMSKMRRGKGSDPEEKMDTVGQTVKVKMHDVKWQLTHLKADFKQEQVQGILEMPSDLPGTMEGTGPHVRLFVSANEDNMHALSIMRSISSINVLHARLVVEGPSSLPASLLAWVEPYDGNLREYLTAKSLCVPEFYDKVTPFVLPTPILGSTICQAIDGIEQLRVSGHYHGNFSLANTYYKKDKDSGNLLIKLANFRKKAMKDHKFHVCTAEDWSALAVELRWIRQFAKKLNESASEDYPYFECSLLDGLIDMFKHVGALTAEFAFKAIKRQPFFWGKQERKIFFIHNIPQALMKDTFCLKVKKAKFIALPWNKAPYTGLLMLMDDYRVKHHKQKYDTNCRVAFVKFISGLYTHEAEFPELVTRTVDSTVQRTDPMLCYELYNLIPHQGLSADNQD